MRFFMRSRLLVLAGIALLLIGVAGCDPGPVRFPADPSSLSPPQAEAAK